MKRQKVGLVLFWIGVIWAVLWGVIGSFYMNSVLHTLTFEELNQTMWALTGPLQMLYGFSIPLGPLVAIVGLLIYSGAKGSTVWKFGIGILLALIIVMPIQLMGHFPPLFGIGGTLIMLLFIGIWWLWAKERMALKGSSTTAADFKLVGYVFMLTATWYTCTAASWPFYEAWEGQTPYSPINIMIFFVLGWLFFFLSHYKSRQSKSMEE